MNTRKYHDLIIIVISLRKPNRFDNIPTRRASTRRKRRIFKRAITIMIRRRSDRS